MPYRPVLVSFLVLLGACHSSPSGSLPAVPAVGLTRAVISDGSSGGSCWSDKVVDQAAQLLDVAAESPTRIRMTADNAMDQSGRADIIRYVFTDEQGATITVSPRDGDPGNFTANRFTPETRYSVVAVTLDGCGNIADSVPLTVTTPALVAQK